METNMATIQTTANPIIEEGKHSAVNWGAVLAGGVAASALMLLLLAFGAGVGFSVVSPWADSGLSATTFSLGAGLFLIVVAMLSSTIGGYIAGRLRTKWVGVHTHEVFFRDTAHGFLAWAFATLLSAGVLGAAVTHITAGASAGAAQGAASATTRPANGSMDDYVDSLFRPGQSASSQNANTPNAAPVANNQNAIVARGEMTRLFTRSLRKGSDFSPADRTYVTQVVATRTGLSQDDAEKRVTEVTNQAKAATDAARKAAAKLSLWLAASMLAGAFAASLAATEGGRLRDERWYETAR
jgi:hypothetical protein